MRTEFLPFQIPASFRGSFKGVDKIERRFSIRLVNTNPENTAFDVEVSVHGALVPWKVTIRSVYVTHGSGISADEIAVKRALAAWVGSAVEVTIDEEDEDA